MTAKTQTSIRTLRFLWLTAMMAVGMMAWAADLEKAEDGSPIWDAEHINLVFLHIGIEFSKINAYIDVMKFASRDCFIPFFVDYIIICAFPCEDQFV